MPVRTFLFYLSFSTYLGFLIGSAYAVQREFFRAPKRLV